MARIADFFKMTRSEKRSQVNGVNLFFGALLGANLGTLGRLAPVDYITLIFGLAAMVCVVQLVSASGRRWYMIMAVASAAVWIGSEYVRQRIRPASLDEADYQKILITLGVWILMLVLLELTPVISAKTRVASPEPTPHT